MFRDKRLRVENAKLKKDNAELLNRMREMKNQMAIIQANFTTEQKQVLDSVNHMCTTINTSMIQLDRALKQTLQRVCIDERTLFGPNYIDEDYDNPRGIGGILG